MDFDLLIKNANSSDGQNGVDIACKNGKIIAIESGIEANAEVNIDAKGHLISPPFVDPHFHMDATLSLGSPRMNVSGTLLEGIGLWSELKSIQTTDQIISRALRYCDLAVSMGIGAIRSHVDICDNSLKGVEALLEVQKIVAPYIDLQLVAFPQDGIFRDPDSKVNLINALNMGVNVVGGIPHF
ncbi:MAG: amidohydrolase family protein, partial [Amylibacter sp.]